MERIYFFSGLTNLTGFVCLCESVCKGADGLEVVPEIRETSVSLSLSLAGLLAHHSKKLHLIRADRVKRGGGGLM